MAPPKQGFPSAQEPLWGCSPHTARPLSPQPQSPGQIVSPLLKQVTVILNPVVKAAPALTEPLYVMAQVKYLSGEPCSSTQTPGAPRQGCLTHAHVCPSLQPPETIHFPRPHSRPPTFWVQTSSCKAGLRPWDAVELRTGQHSSCWHARSRPRRDCETHRSAC